MAERKRKIYGTMRVGSAQIGIAIEKLAEVVGPIRKLSPIMMDSQSLLGGLDLRGDLIPVLDPSSICGSGTAIREPQFAVILRHEGQLMGIGIDEITGLAQVHDDDMRVFDRMAAHDPGVVLGGFLDNGTVTTVLDVPRVFTMVDTLSVKAKSTEQVDKRDTARLQMLTFEAGGALFSIGATEVYGTVPRQKIIQGSMTGGNCLGSITYHDRRVPVMSTVGVFGVGCHKHYQDAETVVLKFPNNRLLGFAVDAINTIEAIDPDSYVPLPDVIAQQNDFLSGVRIAADKSQIYALDGVALRQDQGLVAVADLSDGPTEETNDGQEASENEAASGSRERYLLFDIAEPMATPLSQVVRIIPRPTELTPLLQGQRGVEGVFAHEGHSIPLINLNEDAAFDRAAIVDARVLIVGQGGKQVGFAVNRVRSIEVSAWQHRYETGESQEVGSLVQLGRGANSRVLQCINLAEEAAIYQAALQSQDSPDAQLSD